MKRSQTPGLMQNLHYTLKQKPLHTKNDMKLLQFEQSQLRMFRKIREARSLIDTKTLSRGLPERVRKLKLVQMEMERKQGIVKENHRLHRAMSRQSINSQQSSRLGSAHSSNSQQRRKNQRAFSLNSTLRQAEGQRINLENKRMFEHLSRQRPFVDYENFREHTRRHEQHLLRLQQSSQNLACAFWKKSSHNVTDVFGVQTPTKSLMPNQSARKLKSVRMSYQGRELPSLLESQSTSQYLTGRSQVAFPRTDSNESLKQSSINKDLPQNIYISQNQGSNLPISCTTRLRLGQSKYTVQINMQKHKCILTCLKKGDQAQQLTIWTKQALKYLGLAHGGVVTKSSELKKLTHILAEKEGRLFVQATF